MRYSSGSMQSRKYYYRSCEDILEAVKPLLKKHGCSILLSDEIVCVGDRNYVVSTATITNGTDKWSVTGNAREEESKKGMDGAQITGAASSYARKYALNGLFAIDDAKDSDGTNKHESKPEQWDNESKEAAKKRSNLLHTDTSAEESDTTENESAVPDTITEKQMKRMFAIQKKVGMPLDGLKELVGAYGYEHSNEITKKDYEKIIEEIESWGK